MLFSWVADLTEHGWVARSPSRDFHLYSNAVGSKKSSAAQLHGRTLLEHFNEMNFRSLKPAILVEHYGVDGKV
jgi:hypothetical protein